MKISHLILLILIHIACGNVLKSGETSSYNPAPQDSITPTPSPSPVPTPRPSPSPQPSPSQGSVSMWRPPLISSWQWQLTTPVDQSLDVSVYDIDLFENSASVVASLHAKGKKVICYVSVGAWEDWRPDANNFPSSVLGKNNGWPGEKWLDIRRIDLLGPILEARFDLCKAKGFDAIEPDNIDGYVNNTGFPLTYQDQLIFNKYLAEQAHLRGLSIGLKNDLDQIQDLVAHFDFAVNEQCFEFNECKLLSPFIEAGKPVFHVEYGLSSAQFCSKANAMNFNSLKKNLDLDASLNACR